METAVERSGRANRIFGAFLRQGFWIAAIYALAGLSLELLHRFLPHEVYARGAAALYGLPLRILAALELESPLIGAVAHGRIPAGLAAAAVPAIGVAAILLASLAIASCLRFGAFVASLKQN